LHRLKPILQTDYSDIPILLSLALAAELG